MAQDGEGERTLVSGKMGEGAWEGGGEEVKGTGLAQEMMWLWWMWPQRW